MSVFGHYVARGILVLSFVEALIFGSLFLVSGSFLLGGSRGDGIADFAMDVVLPTGIVLICLLVAGGYNLDVWKRPKKMAKRVASGAIGGAALIVLFHDVMTSAGSVSYGMVWAVIVGCAIACLGRWLSGQSSRVQNYINRNTMVLGTGQQAATLWTLFKSGSIHSSSLDGFLRYGSEIDQASQADPRIPEDRIFESALPLCDFAKSRGVEEIVIAFDRPEESLPERALLDCRLKGISVIDSISYVERETGRLGLDTLSLRWLVFCPGFRRGRLRGALKRCGDIVMSSVLLLLFAPLMALTALAVRRDSPGPVVFSQTRVGLGGKPFTMYKFRSMRQDAEGDGKARWAQQNDDRITKLGRFLRKTRLDELPQLYNVLRGDMSLVGPRPERPEFVEGLAAEIPFYQERHSVRPGLTGWAQTSYSYASTIEETRIKLEYDLYYVKNYSLLLDLYVLIQTFRVALRGDGAR